MDAFIVVTNGKFIRKDNHSGMKLYSYNGFLWAIFPKKSWEYTRFAYLWGNA